MVKIKLNCHASGQQSTDNVLLLHGLRNFLSLVCRLEAVLHFPGVSLFDNNFDAYAQSWAFVLQDV